MPFRAYTVDCSIPQEDTQQCFADLTPAGGVSLNAARRLRRRYLGRDRLRRMLFGKIQDLLFVR
jgi:hypothetical protein